MKIARLLLILLIPAMGIVGCQKSTIKPGCPGNTGNERSANAQDDNSSSSVGARTANIPDQSSVNGENGDGNTDIIGSGGDDDREGGKKTKNGAK